MNDKHTETSCIIYIIRCALIIIIIIKLHVALQYSMASNVERERALNGEKRGQESTIVSEERGKLLKKDMQGL